MRKDLFTIFLLLFLSVVIPASEAADLSQVRYWEPVSGQQSAVPHREDPKVLIILYHNLVFGRTGNIYNRDIYNFEHDLAFLKRNFEVIDFNELQMIADGKRELATDAAVITFDDGDLSNYALAYPILRDFNLKATFFLVPSYVGKIGYMNWDQIREMESFVNNAGERLFSFGSHTMTHKALGPLDREQVFRELADSKTVLDAHLESPVTVLALPYGSGAGNKLITELALKSGYSVIRSSRSAAPDYDKLNLTNLPAFNVDSCSTDIFAERVLSLLGRGFH